MRSKSYVVDLVRCFVDTLNPRDLFFKTTPKSRPSEGLRDLVEFRIRMIRTFALSKSRLSRLDESKKYMGSGTPGF